MILTRVEQSDWLSNAYLVFDEPGGNGVLVDSNTVTDPLVELAEREGIEITPRGAHAPPLRPRRRRAQARRAGRRADLRPPAHRRADRRQGRRDVRGRRHDRDRRPAIEVIHTPGHCGDHCALRLNDTDVLTADVLFKGTVGGTRAPGATGFEDLKNSVMEKLMKLPPETRVHPGHREPTTIGAEWEENPFVRIWRGLDDEGSEPVTIGPADAEEREEATLVLWAPDYDGGNKAWVRLADGTDAIVGGSQVKREG